MHGDKGLSGAPLDPSCPSSSPVAVVVCSIFDEIAVDVAAVAVVGVVGGIVGIVPSHC